MVRYLQVRKYYRHACKFQKWLPGHDGTFNSNKIYFVLLTWLIEYRKQLGKITTRSKKRKSSKTDVSDLILEYVKMFLMKFQNGSNFREKFQAALKHEFRKSNKNSHVTPLCYVKTKGENESFIFDSLSQFITNATHIITKCGSCFITKCDRNLLQNVSVFYYKMRQLL